MECHHQSNDTVPPYPCVVLPGGLGKGCCSSSFCCRLWKPVGNGITFLDQTATCGATLESDVSEQPQQHRNEESGTNTQCQAHIPVDRLACRPHGVPRCVCTGEPRSPAGTAPSPSRLFPHPAPAEHTWAKCLLIPP